ncbi:MAG TPA: hypothetical protein VEW67_03260 [Thermoleophilaceae bacterium]|nr:hypothetical protein [Thermoleophilaceae bacterium]
MILRNGNIGAAVAIAMLIAGFLIFGTDPSDTERQLIFWPAFFTGIAVMMVLEGRAERRERQRDSSR